MKRYAGIVSFVIALIMLVGVCSFTYAEAKNGKWTENMLGLAAANPDGFDPLSILPEELASHYEKKEISDLDKQSGLIGSFKSNTDDYQDFDIYCYVGGVYPLEYFALREAAMFNSVAIPMTDYGEFYHYSSYQVIDGDEYYTNTYITEIDSLIFEIVSREKTERVKIGSSSRSFCLPSTCAEAIKPKDKTIAAEFRSGAPKGYYFKTINKITIYEDKLKDGEPYADYLSKLAKENDFIVETVTRNGKDYVVLIGDNGDGTVDVGYCFEENGIGYDLCFTAEEDLFWEMNNISHTILEK